MAKQTLPDKSDFSEWYAEIVLQAELISHTGVSGCSIFRPYSYEMWETIQDYLDERFKAEGVKNAYFPSLIPEDLLTKEKDHIEGFAPEVAWVTHGGDKKLGKKLAIRPTSETIVCEAYSDWIRSHRDLPMKLNQWANIVRWEFKHPTPFLRNREFLWQEGHTAFSNKEDAEEEVKTILTIYKDVYEDILAIPVFEGQKSEDEKFPGAEYTYTLETLLPNGKAVQGCTSHYLGTSFAEAYDIQFLDENGENQYVHQNSWGLSTRTLGALIGIHGDDQGLKLPPKIAPIKAVVIPIVFSDKPEVSEEIMDISKTLSERNGWELDDSDKSPGYKFNHWELKGVPVRIEIGPRDMEDDVATVVRRDTGEKQQVPIDDIEETVDDLHRDIQQNMYEEAKDWLHSQVEEINTLEELKNVVNDGKIAKSAWEGTPEQEETIQDETGAKSLCRLEETGKCFLTGEEENVYLFGKTI